VVFGIGVCAVLAVGSIAWPWLRPGYAQETTPADTNPAPTQRIPLVDPGKTIAATVTPVSESPSPEAVAQTPAPAQSAKQEDRAAPAGPRQKQISDDTASLMKLANSLKAEVAKTTPDTMSVLVIRQAEEIEKLAHKMRTQ
jgi:hypothetical protein